MREARITIQIPEQTAVAVYAKICDFGRYAEVVDAVQSVTVHNGESESECTTDWIVFFRNGLLKWTEVDQFDISNGIIDFRQTTGDFDQFYGKWTVSEYSGGSEVVFEATFDFGIPSLAGILEPIAARVLKENIAQVLIGLVGAIEVVDDDQVARAVGAPSVLSRVA